MWQVVLQCAYCACSVNIRSFHEIFSNITYVSRCGNYNDSLSTAQCGNLQFFPPQFFAKISSNQLFHQNYTLSQFDETFFKRGKFLKLLNTLCILLRKTLTIFRLIEGTSLRKILIQFQYIVKVFQFSLKKVGNTATTHTTLYVIRYLFARPCPFGTQKKVWQG